MKKIIISLCLMLIPTVIVICCYNEQLKSENLVLISNTKKFDKPQAIIEYLSGMESELNFLISKNKGIKENSKIFGMYMKNASFQINIFMEVTDFKQNGNFQTLDIDKQDNHFINPRVNNVYISYASGVNLVFDYNYILKNYGSYLDEIWNTYIKYKIDSNNDFEYFLYEDFSEDTYKKFKDTHRKWLEKWSEFITLYPYFFLIEEIKQQIKEHEDKLKE